MDVQQVVRRAKTYVEDVYADEKIVNVGLEEVKLDPSGEVWRITVGFSRPWDGPKGFAAAPPIATTSRSLKIVRIDDRSGDVLSMESREPLLPVR